MHINKLVFGGLVLACLVAAGGGAYLATRHNGQPATATVAPAESAAVPARGPQPVAASEGVVTPEPANAAVVPQAAPAASAPAPSPAARRPQAVAAAAPRRDARPVQREASARPAPRPEATAPSPVATAPSAGGSMWEPRPSVQAEAPEREPATLEPAAAPEPVKAPEPEFVELVVPADAVIGLQLESTVSSDRAKVEDAVGARVTRDVRVGGRVAIPAGSMVHGTVTEVERGGKVRERARLGIRFHTVVLADGDRLSLRTDAIIREGTSQGRESAAKIGGAAVGGAILGAILGGKKGAAIGGAVGAGGGTAAVMAGEANAVVVPAGSTVSVRIQQPVTVTIAKE